MKKKLPHYPFVEPSIALLIQRKGYEIQYHALYEKGYTYDKKRILPKLQKFDRNSIEETIKFIKDQKWKEAFDKRPKMYLPSSNIPVWCVPAPTYDEVIDWLYDIHKIFISFRYDHKLANDYSWDFFYKNDLLYRCNDWFYTPKEAKKNCIEFLLINLKNYIN